MEDPVVEPVLEAVPELDALRAQPVAAPVGRAGDLLPDEALVYFPHLLEQAPPRREGGALAPGPGRHLLATGAGRELEVRLVVGQPLHRPLHAHLDGDRGPVEAESGPRIPGELAPL